MMKNLEKNTQQTPFKVPENYFDELNERILNSTSEKSVGRIIRQRGLSIIRPWLSLAAIITGAALITLAVLHLTGRGSHALNDDSNGTLIADIPQFLVDGIDLYLIELDMHDNIGQGATSEVNMQDDIVEYLMVNEIDFTILLEYLNDKLQL